MSVGPRSMMRVSKRTNESPSECELNRRTHRTRMAGGSAPESTHSASSLSSSDVAGCFSSSSISSGSTFMCARCWACIRSPRATRVAASMKVATGDAAKNRAADHSSDAAKPPADAEPEAAALGDDGAAAAESGLPQSETIRATDSGVALGRRSCTISRAAASPPRSLEKTPSSSFGSRAPVAGFCPSRTMAIVSSMSYALTASRECACFFGALAAFPVCRQRSQRRAAMIGLSSPVLRWIAETNASCSRAMYSFECPACGSIMASI
eukprot:Amastigsp_a843934_29.p2 type:complete len:267 gc:universal Amastigsp_a843934_29:486-1286(+)